MEACCLQNVPAVLTKEVLSQDKAKVTGGSFEIALSSYENLKNSRSKFCILQSELHWWFFRRNEQILRQMCQYAFVFDLLVFMRAKSKQVF